MHEHRRSRMRERREARTQTTLTYQSFLGDENMQAIMLREFGQASNLKLETLPDPRAGSGELLIKVRACGVCYHDVLMRKGMLPGTNVPAILGHEVVGEVVQVGEGVQGWKVDQRAATLQRMSCG